MPMIITLIVFASLVALYAVSYPAGKRAQDLVPDMHSISSSNRARL